MKKNIKVLFLVRKNYNYGYGTYGANQKAGLINSVKFLTEALEEQENIETKIAVCVDGNSIDKELFDFKPDVCVVDAIWVTPTKLREVQRLHPNVLFVMRIHSKVPFLANEGNSIKWLKEYSQIPNTLVSNNNPYSNEDFNEAGIISIYLPNVYREVQIELYSPVFGREINIGCFGAIRPLKNQLLQAFAAIRFANRNHLILNFHINAGRIEDYGENVLRNLTALFEDTPHKLTDDGWKTHEEFLRLVYSMDIGMQVSYSESYNIVAADFVSQGVPVVVSDEIYWMIDALKAHPNDAVDIADKLKVAYNRGNHLARRSVRALNRQREDGIETWTNFLKYVI